MANSSQKDPCAEKAPNAGGGQAGESDKNLQGRMRDPTRQAGRAEQRQAAERDEAGVARTGSGAEGERAVVREVRGARKEVGSRSARANAGRGGKKPRAKTTGERGEAGAPCRDAGASCLPRR